MDEGFPTEIRFEIGKRPNDTTAGLLIAVVQKARGIGFFETLSGGLNLKMKVYDYSHQNKIEAVVAGLAVGCRHINEMQTKLVPDTVAAGLFGMVRFPDQAQINAFLRRCGAEQAAHLEQAHERLLIANSYAGERTRWLQLADGQRMLPVDWDQTSLVTRSLRATGTAHGCFGHKRGKLGYKKTVALLGQDVKEVLWLRLEAGNTAAQEAAPLILEKMVAFGKAKGIAPGEMLVRGDSQYGNVGVIRQVEAAGFHYLFKGANYDTARFLAEHLDCRAVWTYVGEDSNGSRVWVVDAGKVELHGHDDRAGTPAVKTRVVLLVRVAFRARKKRGCGAPDCVMEKVVRYEHLVTDLPADALPVDWGAPAEVGLGRLALDVYNDRETEESFFRAEQDGFGAQYLRTHKGEGEAAFLWLLASTANLLRWVQCDTFRGTQLEKIGLAKLVSQAMHIPATIIRESQRWIVLLPETARLVCQLVSAWVERTCQLRLPFFPPEYST